MRKLPSKILVEDTKNRLQEMYDKRQKYFQEAVEKFSELRSLKVENVEQLEQINSEWLEGEISKSKANLSLVFGAQGGFIPAGITRQFSDEYERVRNECQEPINRIQENINWCKTHGIGIKIDSKGRPWLNEKDVKEAVEREATHTFSEAEKEYYEIFQNIFADMDALRAYESKHGLAPSNLQEIMSQRIVACYIEKKPYQYSPDEYLRLIYTGNILRGDI